jgi:hypothetical protein
MNARLGYEGWFWQSGRLNDLCHARDNRIAHHRSTKANPAKAGDAKLWV